MVRLIKAQSANPWTSVQDARNSFPHRDLADDLVNAYFRTFESAYRILHIPSFEKGYDRFWTTPGVASTSFTITIMLVMAIGVCFYQGHEDRRNLRVLARRWTNAVDSWIGPFGKDQLTLGALQAQCLLILARQINSVGGDLIWISVGTLLRVGILMGLHRDPDLFPHMTPLNAEIRRRLWTTILELAVQSSLELGMPPMINLAEFDTKAPSNIDDSDIGESTKQAPTPKPESTFTRASVQILLRKSLAVRLDIVKTINDFQLEPSYDAVLALSTKLTNACRESALWARIYSSASSGRVPTTFHRNLIDYLLRRFQIGLHRPYAMKARTDPRFYYSRKICTEVGVAIGSPEPDPDFERLLLLGGIPYREISLHAAQTVCLELINQLEEDKADLLPSSQSRARQQPIRESVSRALEWSRQRIEADETNIKPYIFFNMVVAQIEAMEVGSPPEPAILAAAKTSVETCLELLKARTADLTNTNSAELVDPAMNEGESFGNLGLDPLQAINFDDPTDSWLYSSWAGYVWPEMSEL